VEEWPGGGPGLSGAGCLRGRVIVLAGLLTAAAAARQLSPRGILIGWAVYFTGWPTGLFPTQ